MAILTVPRFGSTLILTVVLVAPPPIPSPAPPLLHTRDVTTFSTLKTRSGQSILKTRG